MRTTEGKGLIPPRRVRERLDDEDLSYARTLTRQRCQYRGYSGRADEWGQGLIGLRAVYVGFVGEVAFAKWVNRKLGVVLAVDSQTRLRGDYGIDFRLLGRRIQLKTATANYSDTLVRCADMADPAWDIIVRAQWPSRRVQQGEPALFDGGPRLDTSVCELCGWLTEQEFRWHSRIEPARIGEHNNYALPPERLKCMDDLAQLFSGKMELQGGAS